MGGHLWEVIPCASYPIGNQATVYTLLRNWRETGITIRMMHWPNKARVLIRMPRQAVSLHSSCVLTAENRSAFCVFVLVDLATACETSRNWASFTSVGRQ